MPRSVVRPGHVRPMEVTAHRRFPRYLAELDAFKVWEVGPR
jgi:hypothetical protein